jgi:hypothetical protein
LSIFFIGTPSESVFRAFRFVLVLLRVLEWSIAMGRRTTLPFLVILIRLVKLFDAMGLVAQYG